MLLNVAENDRAAMQYDDVASALEAGLAIEALGGNPKDGDQAVHGILRSRGVKISAAENLMIAAAWSAGRVTDALRGRARQRRQRAEFGRQLRTGLRYPALVLALALLLSVIGTQVFGSGLAIAVVSGLAVLGLLGWWIYRGITFGGDRWLQVPWLGPLAAGLGELPYLETLHALYASGVPIIDAHAQATASVTVTSLRLRLRAAERALRDGSNLAEALASSDALMRETRQILATGEGAGQLEDALDRTLIRRREVTARDVATTARMAGNIAYFGAGAVAVAFILNFYLGYLAALGIR